MEANYVSRPMDEGVEENMPGGAIPFDVNFRVTGGSGTAASITLTANANAGHIIHQIIVSFSASPAAGTYVRIDDGQGSPVIYFKQYVVATVPVVIKFEPPRVG